MASSSSASVLGTWYDVFLSFRGETRYIFTDHLYASLLQNNINVFRDDEGLEKGTVIWPALKEVIKRSRISIVIFSKDYATSRWCLKEVAKIIKYQKINRQIVLPVFYDVDPSDVRKQKNTYKASFDYHKKRFKGSEQDLKKLKAWRQALNKVGYFDGWDSRVIRSNAELVKKIVADVLEKLNRLDAVEDFTGFPGLDRRFRTIENLLRGDSLKPLRTIGIWGTVGIGKTTLARMVFHRLCSKFDASFFVEDIRVEWEQGRKKYYYSKNNLFPHTRLRQKKVLVILDNVTDPEQLEVLREDPDRFGPGSRIVITSTNKQILRGRVDDPYKVEKLNPEEALRLFRLHALKPSADQYDDPARELYAKIVKHAGGIPLALKVLGSFFRGKRREKWEAEFEKLKNFPHKYVSDILKVSYDGLDEMQKRLFLDVACFFANEFRDHAERILEACDLHPKIGLDDLADKSLISFIHGKLDVLSSVQQAAWVVVNTGVVIENRSRIWISQDSIHILETNRGTSSIEVIFLDMSEFGQIEFDSSAFQSMFNLRLLKVFHSDVRKTCQVSVNNGDSSGLQFLPNSLRYLYWEAFPWKSFPTRFRPQCLVELNLPFSNIVQLWEGIQPLWNLIKIDVSHSKQLIKLPDLSQASKLEHVYLEHCTSLSEVPSSLENLEELKTLNLNGCSSIKEFPKVPKSIVCLVLSETGIERVPLWIQYLDHLKILNLSGCQSLLCSQSLPTMPRLEAILLHEPNIEYETQVSVDRVSPTMESQSEAVFSTELPSFDHDQTDPVPIVSIPREVLTKCLAADFGYQVRDLVFFNCLGFYGGGRDVNTVNADLKLCSNSIVSCEFTTEIPIGANIGFCCRGDNIPEWFEQGNEDVVVTSFETRPDREILGFALCAVVNIWDHGPRRHNFLQRLYEDNYKKLNFLCEPTFTRPSDSNCPNGVKKECSLRRSKEISEASFRFWVCNNEDANFGAKVTKCGVDVIYGDYILDSDEIIEADDEPEIENQQSMCEQEHLKTEAPRAGEMKKQKRQRWDFRIKMSLLRARQNIKRRSSKKLKATGL